MNHFKKTLLLLTATQILINQAHAINSLNAQTFNPSTSDHFVLLEDGFRSEWPKTANYYFGGNYNYSGSPLPVYNATQTAKQYDVIDNIQTFDLFFGFKAANNLGLFIGVPIQSVSYSNTAPAFFPKGSTSGIGDLKLLAKIRLTDDASPTSVALIPEFHLPTGNTANFSSDASTYIGARLAIERQFESWTLDGNLGFGAASNSKYSDPQFSQTIDYSKRLIVGIGGFLPFNDTLGMNIEFNNTSMIPFNQSINPNDAYAGLRYAANDSLVFTGGGSVGEIGGPGGTNYRLIAGIRYTLFEDKKQAPRPIVLAPLTTPKPMPSPSPTPFRAAVPFTPAPILAPQIVTRNNRTEIATPTIHFENNSSKVMPDSKTILDQVATLIQKEGTSFKKILIDGHTNNVGKDAYNLKLSLARSKAVKVYLISRGIAAKRIEARGYGMRKPQVPYTEPNATEINRRVEFIIVK